MSEAVTAPAVAVEPVRQPAPLKLDLGVRIRKFCEADKNFILSSWMKSYRNEAAVHSVTNDVFFYSHQVLIGEIAKTADIFLACAHDNPDEVWGWLCTQAGPDGSLIVHYAYTKQRFRRLGLGRQLLEAAGWVPGVRVWATHWSSKCDYLANKFNAKHNPYLLNKGF